MSALDVYEELGRLSDLWGNQACAQGIGWAGESRFISLEEGSGASNAFDAAQQLVEFLRWRDAREEWPADGCECSLLVNFAGGVGLSVWSQRNGSTFRKYYHDGDRWRYLIGPCSCAAQPKEGEPAG